MEPVLYIIIAFFYLSAFIFTVYLLKINYFGYAAFAAPFITYPATSFLVFIIIIVLGLDFDFLGSIYYFLGGFAAYSILSLLTVIVIVPETKVYNIEVKDIKTNATELDVFDGCARPTGEKIAVGLLKNKIDYISHIVQYGSHHVARVPDQYKKPFLKNRELYIDPNYLTFKRPKKLKDGRFTQSKKPSNIKYIDVGVKGLKDGVEVLTLLNKSGERSRKTIDREDFYEYLPRVSKVTFVNKKIIITIPEKDQERKAIRVSPEHLEFESPADKKRIEKFHEYRKSIK